jgi:hypothetical protein
MKNEKPKKQHISRAVLVAAAGITAGYYFYASKNAKANRKIAAKWANDLKSKVIREAKKHGTPDKKTLANIVDAATKTYAKVSKLDSKKLADAAGELKTHWQKIAREINTSPKSKPSAKPARKAAKKRPGTRGK